MPLAVLCIYSQIISFVIPRHAAVDTSGNVYLEGGASPSFQPTVGAYQSTHPHSTSLTKISLPKSAVTVSAANYSGSPLACEAIVSAFGTGLATSTQSAASLPLPKTLGGTTIKVRDSAGTERDAALFFASPTQINFQIPPGTANGNATHHDHRAGRRKLPLQCRNRQCGAEHFLGRHQRQRAGGGTRPTYRLHSPSSRS